MAVPYSRRPLARLVDGQPNENAFSSMLGVVVLGVVLGVGLTALRY